MMLIISSIIGVIDGIEREIRFASIRTAKFVAIKTMIESAGFLLKMKKKKF